MLFAEAEMHHLMLLTSWIPQSLRAPPGLCPWTPQGALEQAPGPLAGNSAAFCVHLSGIWRVVGRFKIPIFHSANLASLLT